MNAFRIVLQFMFAACLVAIGFTLGATLTLELPDVSFMDRACLMLFLASLALAFVAQHQMLEPLRVPTRSGRSGHH